MAIYSDPSPTLMAPIKTRLPATKRIYSTKTEFFDVPKFQFPVSFWGFIDRMAHGGQFSGDASGSASWEGYQESPPQPFPRRDPDFGRDFYHEDRFAATRHEGFLRNSEDPPAVRDDVKSCFVVSAAFSFFASMCMAFGLYGSEILKLGPNSSTLINPNHLFVESVQVVGLGTRGSMLYGFYKLPPIDDNIAWSETHKITFPANTHKEWVYYLNGGSQISINYTVDSSSSLVLVLVGGNEGLVKWLEDPSNPSTVLSWNMIYGAGRIHKDVFESSTYYIAIGNLNSDVVKVELNAKIEALLYNTSQPYYRCSPSEGQCNFPLSFLGGNAAVLTTPSRAPGVLDGDWRVKLSYGPRWIMHLLLTGGMISLLLLINYSLNHFQRRGPQRRTDRIVVNEPERNPLISHEADKHSSQSSSVSDGDGSGEDAQGGTVRDGKPVKDDGDNRHHCAICFDAPRDCFFLPCGHCVSCTGCATRVLDASGSCPICRRRIKKVRKIVTA